MMAPAHATRETRATTVRLPRPVYDQAKRFVDSEKKTSTNRLSLNEFFVTAIQAYLKLYERRQIDAAFAAMAENADYQKEANLLAEEFEASDWEALGLGDNPVAEEERVLAGAGTTR